MMLSCRTITTQPEGAAELLMAPPREALVATAAAVAAAAARPGGCGAFRFDDAFDDDGEGWAHPDAGFAERATRAMARREREAARRSGGEQGAPPAEECV
jgi:hypothetical protein